MNAQQKLMPTKIELQTKIDCLEWQLSNIKKEIHKKKCLTGDSLFKAGYELVVSDMIFTFDNWEKAANELFESNMKTINENKEWEKQHKIDRKKLGL